MRRLLPAAVLSAALVFPLFLVHASAQEAPQGNAVKLQHLGSHHRPVTTTSPEAQAWFDQGLILTFGFNHEAAILSYAKAAQIDPSCAMAQWGMSYAAGPHINNPVMEEAASKAAYDGAQIAKRLADKNGSPVERDLVNALVERYAWPAPESRAALDQAYADAMGEVWKKYPNDADVGALYAESLMDLRPWDLWTHDGQPQPGTLHIVEVLEQVLALEPMNPAANHFYIHTMEASTTPEKAAPCADRLRDMVPDAGHLVHMPGHIDIRLGHYDAAVIANQKAVAADLRYVNAAGRGGFYTMYRAHNYHFLAYAAMFEGRREVAMQAMRDLQQEMPVELVQAFPDFLDAFVAVPIHVMVRFGMWQEILDEPIPAENELLAARAFWRYGRTVAFSSLGRVDEAKAEFAEFRKAMAAVPESRLLGNNPVAEVLEIGSRMAEGEMEYRAGNYERAFALLREGVELDDTLRYDEPWGWMQPVRHALGALLLEQGKLEEAESVYRKDLDMHPGNGWSLHGLAETLRREGKTLEADKTDAAFQEAWRNADIKIDASCYCRRG